MHVGLSLNDNIFKKVGQLICIIGCLYLPNGFADTVEEAKPARTYQVELIVFKNINPPINNETFPNYPALPLYENSIELSDLDETLIGSYMKLPHEKFSLNREANLIAKKEHYEVLLHESWLQQQDQEHKVHLKSDETSNDILEGTLQINRAYYYKAVLHFDLQSHHLGSVKHFVLNTKRNLKNSEMHFIDHPQFGILLKITTL